MSTQARVASGTIVLVTLAAAIGALLAQSHEPKRGPTVVFVEQPSASDSTEMLDQPVLFFAAMRAWGRHDIGVVVRTELSPDSSAAWTVGPSRTSSARVWQEEHGAGSNRVLVSATSTELRGSRLIGGNAAIAETLADWARRHRACYWPPLPSGCGDGSEGPPPAYLAYVCDLGQQLQARDVQPCGDAWPRHDARTNSEAAQSAVLIGLADNVIAALDVVAAARPTSSSTEGRDAPAGVGGPTFGHVALADSLATSTIVNRLETMKPRPTAIHVLVPDVATPADPAHRPLFRSAYWGRVLWHCFGPDAPTERREFEQFDEAMAVAAARGCGTDLGYRMYELPTAGAD